MQKKLTCKSPDRYFDIHNMDLDKIADLCKNTPVLVQKYIREAMTNRYSSDIPWDILDVIMNDLCFGSFNNFGVLIGYCVYKFDILRYFYNRGYNMYELDDYYICPSDWCKPDILEYIELLNSQSFRNCHNLYLNLFYSLLASDHDDNWPIINKIIEILGIDKIVENFHSNDTVYQMAIKYNISLQDTHEIMLSICEDTWSDNAFVYIDLIASTYGSEYGLKILLGYDHYD